MAIPAVGRHDSGMCGGRGADQGRCRVWSWDGASGHLWVVGGGEVPAAEEGIEGEEDGAGWPRERETRVQGRPGARPHPRREPVAPPGPGLAPASPSVLPPCQSATEMFSFELMTWLFREVSGFQGSRVETAEFLHLPASAHGARVSLQCDAFVTQID